LLALLVSEGTQNSFGVVHGAEGVAFLAAVLGRLYLLLRVLLQLFVKQVRQLLLV
jgi:hypothetical protein